MKLCRHCEHIYDNNCDRRKVRKVSPVYGGVDMIMVTCESERSAGWLWCRLERTCGLEGRFFKEIKK